MTSFLVNALLAIRLYLSFLWFHICRYVSYYMNTTSYHTTTDFFHKVVIIGDDFAAGVGDYMILGSAGGLAEYLKPLIKRNEKVRHSWEIINAGIPGSISSDWIMNANSKLLNNVLTSKRTRDAEIFVVMVGSLDLKNNPDVSEKEILNNIKDICDTLRKKGKKVCVGTLAYKDPLLKNIEQLSINKEIKEFCKGTLKDDIPVVLGPQLDNYAFQRASGISLDGYHFNSTSYKTLAKNSTDAIIPMLTAVEWSTWKKKLVKAYAA